MPLPVYLAFICIFLTLRLDNDGFESTNHPFSSCAGVESFNCLCSSSLPCKCTWLKSEENEGARKLLFNLEDPRIAIFRAREEPQQFFSSQRGAKKKIRL